MPSNLIAPSNTPTSTPNLPNSAPPAKRLRVPAPGLSQDLGKCIARDVELVQKLGWNNFVRQRRGRGDLSVSNVPHPAARLLHHYKHHGAPVKLSSKNWTNSQLNRAINRGPHQSCHQHLEFLEEEFQDMINKDQWVILPFSIAKTLPGLRLSPPGVIPQRDRRPRWICDYTWSGVNDDTLPLAPLEAMQFGHALDRYLRELLLSNPAWGPLYLIKLDISDGFYRVGLSPLDIPKLGVVFPTRPGHDPKVALPLVLPMGWKNSPPVFSAVTETAADIANANLMHNTIPPPHPLESHAAKLDEITPTAAPCYSLQPPCTSHPSTTASAPASVPVNPSRDPSLPNSPTPTSYIDVFVDDFIGICQGVRNRSRVRQTLLHAVDTVFRPTDYYDGIHRREPVSIKKLRKGDCSWSTVKLILGWIIDTVTMTISLPPHRVTRLAEILSSLPRSQKRTSVKKWHKVLGELRSMSLALPGARNLFSSMQDALKTTKKHRICLKKEVHQALDDFRWMHADITKRPTRIAEVIPLLPSGLGYHDASGSGAGGVWYTTPDLVPRQGTLPSQPILWRLQWPDDLVRSLITQHNPDGTVTNSEFELAGGLLHLDTITQCYDVRERTLVSKTDNLATMFWQRKGSATTTKAPAHLLRLFGIHQRIHRYVPRHDYIPGPSNPMADDASRLFHLSDTDFLTYFNTKYPQPVPYKLVTLSWPMNSSVTSALRRRTSNAVSLQAELPLPTPTGQNGTSLQLNWASVPYSKPSKTKYPSFKSSSDAFALEELQPARIKSSLEQLKSTYGALRKRSKQWGPLIPAWTQPVISTSASLVC